MLIAALVLVIVGVTALILHQRRKKKKIEGFLRMVRDADVEGRWAEIITQAHQTMPAEEVQKLERAMYMHAFRDVTNAGSHVHRRTAKPDPKPCEKQAGRSIE